MSNHFTVSKALLDVLNQQASTTSSFQNNSYVSGETRKKIWISIMERVDWCEWCIKNGCPSAPNYDAQSFDKWQLTRIADPIEIFNEHLKLKKSNKINYSLLLNYLNLLANHVAGINGYKKYHILYTPNKNYDYSVDDTFNDLKVLEPGLNHMISLI